MRNAKRMSRRALLALAAALGLAGGARAQQELKESEKIPQKDAHYKNSPDGDQSCQICAHFLPPAKCQIVRGPISPHGWCEHFAAKENAH